LAKKGSSTGGKKYVANEVRRVFFRGIKGSQYPTPTDAHNAFESLLSVNTKPGKDR